jgi:hypothetical protein
MPALADIDPDEERGSLVHVPSSPMVWSRGADMDRAGPSRRSPAHPRCVIRAVPPGGRGAPQAMRAGDGRGLADSLCSVAGSHKEGSVASSLDPPDFGWTGRRGTAATGIPYTRKTAPSTASPSAPTARPSLPDTASSASAAVWCCGTWPRANVWRRIHSAWKGSSVLKCEAVGFLGIWPCCIPGLSSRSGLRRLACPPKPGPVLISGFPEILHSN